jgi:type IV secretory pathway VirJ component
MIGRFPHLSTFTKKLLEVIGAGLASAVVAGLLGQTDKPAAPLSPVVYLSPADAQMIRLMHNDQAALLERLRSQPEMPAAIPVAPADIPAAQPAVASTPAPARSAAAASSHREPKPERAPAVAVKRRSDEPLPVASASPAQTPPVAVAALPVAPPEAAETHESPVPAVVTEAVEWVSALKQIPGWFWPAGGGLSSAAPRPPMPVGRFLSHVM